MLAWNRELFAPDRAIIDAFVWQDKRELGFDIRAYYKNRIAGFAHVFPRLGRLGTSSVLIGALGGVMTASELQHRGIGSAVVRAAGAVILKNLRADFGALLCKASLLPFYSALGWRAAQTPVIVHQGEQRLEWPHQAMLLFADGAHQSASEVDLGGPPF